MAKKGVLREAFSEFGKGLRTGAKAGKRSGSHCSGCRKLSCHGCKYA
jgi:hypothetical protein